MKQQFGKWHILIPVGLCFLAGAITITQFNIMPDSIKGILFGIGIGIMALPFILKKIKPSNP